MEEASSSDDEYLYVLRQDKTQVKTPTVSLKIDDTIVEMIVDTGASTDILDEATFEKVNHLKHIELQPPTYLHMGLNHSSRYWASSKLLLSSKDAVTPNSITWSRMES